MSDNNQREETRQDEQQTLEHQQQDLFRELSREQTEAERFMEEDKERSVEGKPQDENDD